jgi:tetratricopeptide (TPR) repeat protein
MRSASEIPDELLTVSLKLAAYAQRAQCHSASREYDAALADLDQAIRLLPTNPKLFHLRAIIHNEAGDADGELADLRRAAQIAPDNKYYTTMVEETVKVQARAKQSQWISAAAAIGLVVTGAIVVDMLSGDNNGFNGNPPLFEPYRYHSYPMGGTKQQVDQWWREEKYGSY